MYITALAQLRFWLLVSGDDDGDDSELVDEADRGVSRSTRHHLSWGQGRRVLLTYGMQCIIYFVWSLRIYQICNRLCFVNKSQQAGPSRATLGIPSELSSHFLLETLKEIQSVVAHIFNFYDIIFCQTPSPVQNWE